MRFHIVAFIVASIFVVTVMLSANSLVFDAPIKEYKYDYIIMNKERIPEGMLNIMTDKGYISYGDYMKLSKLIEKSKAEEAFKELIND